MEQEIRFVTARDGVRIGLALMGEGKPLVKAPNWLNHVGLDIESPVWKHWWAELSAGRQLIRFDSRGTGLSDRNVLKNTFESWVGDLETVVDSLHLERFDLLGMSQGSAIAIDYAARHPERVSRLILFGSFARGWAKRGDEVEHEAILALTRRGWASDNPAYRQLFTSQFMPDASLEQMTWFNEVQRLSTSAETAVEFQREVGNIDVTRQLAKIRAPTLVLHCENDARIPFEEGRRVAAAIPRARFVQLPSRNHVILESDPAWPAFKLEFERFLAQAPPGITGPFTLEAEENHHESLTQRELEVLRLISSGQTDRQIATELTISVRTAGNHVKNILAKTGATNRTPAAIYGAKHGLI